MDDIYEICNAEGKNLVDEIDKLRQKRSRGKLIIKDDQRSNIQVENFRRKYLLASSHIDVFAQAAKFFMAVGNNAVILTLVYDRCHITYYLRAENDWKVIDVEIADINSCTSIKPNKPKLAGRTEATALLILVRLSYTYGFSRIFQCDSPNHLRTMFDTIIPNSNLDENAFGLEAKVIDLISQNGLRKEFLRNYKGSSLF